MSAVVYDVGYNTIMIKIRKNMVTVGAFSSYKRKTTSQDIDGAPKQYLDFEVHCHI